MDGKSHTVKLGASAKALRPLLEPLHEWITVDSPKPPPIVLNKHCPLCPFQRLCHTQAEHEDNLSLLDGVTARGMRQYEKKGIFTKSAEKPRHSCRGGIGVGRAGLNAQEPNKTHAVPEPSMGEGTAEREAPAFMP